MSGAVDGIHLGDEIVWSGAKYEDVQATVDLIESDKNYIAKNPYSYASFLGNLTGFEVDLGKYENVGKI